MTGQSFFPAGSPRNEGRGFQEKTLDYGGRSRGGPLRGTSEGDAGKKRCGLSASVRFKSKKARIAKQSGLSVKKKFGGVLLSHSVARAVPSALKSLTSVFGMGTGVTSLLLPPKIVISV